MTNKTIPENLHKVVIVGGGAAGLELATKLGKKFGKKKKAQIMLIDSVRTHLWKPLLHEVAAGSLNSYGDETGYMVHAHVNHFLFRLGKAIKVDREKQLVITAPQVDEDGNEYIPSRSFEYDTLILAVGSVTNDFGIKGVKEHCYFLDSREQADKFHQDLLKSAYIAHTQETPLKEGQLHVAIAGAGATGVELAAELHESIRELATMGLNRFDPENDIEIHIIEAADRILPGLPERLSAQTAKTLEKLNVQLHTSERVSEATKEGFKTESGELIPAEIKVWAAGIKAPEFLAEIDGLETNRINQLSVHKTLQTTNDENIFAMGDCAACPMEDGKFVPPRAQAAHQQASLLYKSIKYRLAGKDKMPEYKYVDYGSLINLSSYTTVGSLMGTVSRKFSSRVFIEGVIARFVYWSLYKMHLMAIHGFIRTTFMTIANFLTMKTKPRTKLH